MENVRKLIKSDDNHWTLVGDDYIYDQLGSDEMLMVLSQILSGVEGLVMPTKRWAKSTREFVRDGKRYESLKEEIQKGDL